MEWKNKIDECCADELEEMVIDNIKAGFLSNNEILEECKEYMEDNYPNDCRNITGNELLQIIEMLRGKFKNNGNQENFLRLDSIFNKLTEQGIVSLHCCGYTQSDGFDDCNEIATEKYENGEKIVGCCFYNMQDIEHILHEESTSLHLSFGNYFDKPNAEEVGQMIIRELRETGFSVEWDGTPKRRIAIKNFKWDKNYID